MASPKTIYWKSTSLQRSCGLCRVHRFSATRSCFRERHRISKGPSTPPTNNICTEANDGTVRTYLECLQILEPGYLNRGHHLRPNLTRSIPQDLARPRHSAASPGSKAVSPPFRKTLRWGGEVLKSKYTERPRFQHCRLGIDCCGFRTIGSPLS